MTPKETKVVSEIKSALALMQRISRQYRYYCTKDGELSQTDLESVLARSQRELSNVVAQAERSDRRNRVREATAEKKTRQKRKED